MASVPRYQRLMELLREKLRSGDYNIGDRFYSQNELMKLYRLSFATVTRAMNELELEGLLVRQQGRGTFVRAIPHSSQAPNNQPRQLLVFIPWDTRTPAHVNFQRLYAALECTCPEGYKLKLIPYGNGTVELEQLLFSREKIDGIIAAYPGDSHLSVIPRLADEFATVVIGRNLSGSSAGSVYTDNCRAAYEAVTYLLNLGHTRIGMISGSLEMTDSADRLEGYRSALLSGGGEVSDSLVVYTTALQLNGYGAAIDLFDRNPGREITAVFAAGDVLALGALSAIRTMGKRVPEDVSVVGFDDMEGAAELDPPLTTVRVPIEQLAARAVHLLCEMVEGGSRRTEELPAQLVIRSSTATASASTSEDPLATSLPGDSK